jgi:hypothetical protein
MFVLWSSPNHTPIKYRCQIKKINWITSAQVVLCGGKLISWVYTDSGCCDFSCRLAEGGTTTKDSLSELACLTSIRNSVTAKLTPTSCVFGAVLQCSYEYITRVKSLVLIKWSYMFLQVLIIESKMVGIIFSTMFYIFSYLYLFLEPHLTTYHSKHVFD